MTDRKRQPQPTPALPVWQRAQARQPVRPTRSGWGGPRQSRTTFGGRGHR
jgi:hypothetical protein